MACNVLASGRESVEGELMSDRFTPEERKRVESFCERLTQLSRETGIVIDGMGDSPFITIYNPITIQDCNYKVYSWGQLEWGRIT